jgi:hypothetical protein
MAQDDQSPPNQTHVTNTNKNNDIKGRPPKKINPEGNSREGEDNHDNLDGLRMRTTARYASKFLLMK